MPDVSTVFEDERILVVNKPTGMPSQPDPSGETSVLDLFPGTWLVHRLDQPVSGLLVLGKTPAPVAFRKLYLAVVYRIPPPDRILTHHLVHDQRKNHTRVYDSPRKNSKEASLSYKIRHPGDRSLLEVELHTGRHHQIRAQLAHLGHPIVNDAKYGGKRNRARGIALHAWQIHLAEPDVTIACPPTSAFFQPFKIDSPQ